MSVSPELLDAGKAIGLFNGAGDFDPSWFEHVFDRAQHVLSNPTQRAAVLSLLDRLLPPEAIAGLPAGEKWHPVLGSQPHGNAYVTVREVSGGVVLGAAGMVFGAAAGGKPAGELRLHVPLVKFTANAPQLAAGKQDSPLALDLRVILNLQRPADPITLKAIRVALRWAPAAAAAASAPQLAIVLEGLGLADGGVRDVELHPDNLGAEAIQVVLALIRQRLAGLPAGNAIQHLLGLLGITGNPIPLFPFASVAHGPAGLQAWLNALLTGNEMTEWLGHLAAMLGIAAPATQGNGTQAQPWRTKLAHLGPNGQLEARVARVNGHLHVGFGIALAGGPTARLDAGATLVAIPLAGTGAALPLPRAEIMLLAPGGAGPLVSDPGTVVVQAMRAGVRWNGNRLDPVIELQDVDFGGAHRDLIDLTNADTVTDVVGAGVEGLLTAALGGNGAPLLALVGLSAPQGTPPGWPHHLDLAGFVHAPTKAIAAVHRAALASATHHWGFLLGEVARLLGLPAAVAGAGTDADPWRVALASQGPVAVQLIAWNAAPAQPTPRLCLGLRVQAAQPPWQATWRAALLAFDLPPGGGGGADLLGGQDVTVAVSPLPSPPNVQGVTMAASAARLVLSWSHAAGAQARAEIADLAFTIDGETHAVGTLSLPPAAPIDLANPATLPLPLPQLERAVSGLIAVALRDWAGPAGQIAGALIGLHGKLPGLPADWPLLFDPAHPELVFTDPPAALRGWLDRLATGVAGGTPNLPRLLGWVGGLLEHALPGEVAAIAAALPRIAGAGHYTDPWRVPLGAAGTGRRADLLLWLDPDGGPGAWAAPLAAAILSTGSPLTLLRAAAPVASLSPAAREIFKGASLERLAAGFDEIRIYLEDCDGLVPTASQLVTGDGWTAGPIVPNAAHNQQPSNASLIGQALDQIEAWEPVVANRAVLLLHPAFADQSCWSALLAAAQARNAGATAPGAHFELRVAGADPLALDLQGVTTVTRFYTANLQDDGTGNHASLAAQIGRIATRIAQLRPGAKLFLVAHSTAGIAARVFAADNPAKVAGIVTLGTPHRGALLTPLLDPVAAEALRVAGRLLPQFAAGPIKTALTQLVGALDPWLPPAAPDGLPVAHVFPVGSFSPTETIATGGVPGLALGSRLGAPFFPALRAAWSALAAGAAGAALPTHFGVGIRADLGERVGPGVSARLAVRADLARFALRTGVAVPPRPARAVEAVLTLADPSGGYVAGAPQAHLAIGAAPGDIRVRRLELRLRLVQGPGGLSASIEGEALDAAFHTPTVPRLDLTDALAAPVIGAAFAAVFDPPPSAGTWLAELADGLAAVGMLVADAQGRLGLSLDGLNALRIDPLAYLQPRVQAALGRPQGWLGLRPAAGGGYSLPVEPFILSYLPAGGGRIMLAGHRDWNAFGGAGDLALAFEAGLSLSPLQPRGNVSLVVGAVTATVDLDQARVAISAPPWITTPLALLPAPPPATLRALANTLLPRFLVSSGLALGLRSILPADQRMLALDPLIADPAAFFSRPGGLGKSSGNGLALERITLLLTAFAEALGQPGPAVDLPAGLRLTATGSDSVTFALQTQTPIGGVLGLGLSATVDPLLHVSPGGGITLALPAVGAFPGLQVQFGVAAGQGVSLSVTPGGSAPIQLLPTFGGFGALLSGAAETLLPAVLDAMLNALPQPRSTFANDAVAVATALDLYDAGGGFTAHRTQWHALLAGGSIGAIVAGLRGQFLTAASSLLNHLGLPGSISTPSGKLQWTSPAVAGLTGSLTVRLGWDGNGASFAVGAQNLKLATAPLRLSFLCGFEGGALALSATAAADLQAALGLALSPGLVMTFNNGFDVRLRPFDPAQASPLDIRLLPTAQIVAGADLPQRLSADLLLPLVTHVLVTATHARQNVALWTGGPTIGAVLKAAGLTDAAGNAVAVMPLLPTMVAGLLQGLAAGATVTIGTLKLGFGSDPGRVGAKLSGKLPIPVGDYKLTVYFGDTPAGPRPDGGAVTLNLFKLSPLGFEPQLKVVGLGVGFANKDDKPLLDNGYVRLGEVAAFTFFDATLKNALVTSKWGFEADIARFGLPLGQAMSGGGDGGNPVAASMLRSDGGSGGGDPQSVSPETQIVVGYREQKGFYLQIGGSDKPLWITVQRQFGPIYIEQIGVETLENMTKVGLLLDGGVKISGLAVQVDDLTLLVPLTALGDASKWGIDLKGLAVSMEAGTVKLAGGLLKNPGPPTSYDGALMVDVAGRGFTAIGSYARPTDALGEYVSFFVFVSLPIPLGGPPYFFVMGLGGGLGLNRALIPPDDLNQIGSFPLVSAIEGSGFANDPMGALRNMGSMIPPKRGSFWLAAGLKFATFPPLVNTTAVLYVALDRGVEIGLLGLSRMALPTADFAIAQVELALKARFSSAEALLSVQAALTDRSYLFHPSCQLTGGFAFFLWFRTGKFVLTLGGYHPAFQKPPEFPVVARLGFRWSVSNAILIKGESFFALTTTCVMAGGRLEATYEGGPIRAWFKVYAEFLISWDPFYYIFDAGLEIGAAVDTGLFGWVEISRGAKLHIEGPPFYGWVEVDVIITTLRVEFGDRAEDVDYIEDFGVFRDKYLIAGGGNEQPVDVALRAGLLPPEPPGADPTPGTPDAPWRIGAEFQFQTETRMPANKYAGPDGIDHDPSGLEKKIDLAPMNKRDVASRHSLGIRKHNGAALGFALDPDRFKIEQIVGHFPEATWHWVDPRNTKAGAGTVERVGGLTLSGFAELGPRSALIRITGVVDDLPDRALPLPFDLPDDNAFDPIRNIGDKAAILAKIPFDWTVVERFDATVKVLGDQVFAPARADLGVDPQGASKMALAQLNSRSAPPRIAPLSEGLTMAAPGRAAAPAFARIDTVPVALKAPRLVSVMRHRAQPTSDRPLLLRTTVTQAKTDRQAPRVTAPRGATLTGARLHRTAPAAAPAPTRAPAGARSMHNPGFGLTGPKRAQAFERAALQATGEGVPIPAGATQLWQLPGMDAEARRSFRLALGGAGIARVTWLDAAGEPMQDVELPAAGASLTPPDRAAQVAVGCLGALPSSFAKQVAGPAAITAILAPVGHMPTLGWQSGTMLEQVGAQTLLARGATVQMARPPAASAKAAVSVGLVRAGDVMQRQTGTETRFPTSIRVVAILLDAQDPTEAMRGDFSIAADGAELSTPPIPVLGGSRRTLLYDVVPVAGATSVSISVASAAGWRLSGVVGLFGTAAEWADRLHGGVPPQLVPEGALSADGLVTARFTTSRTTPTAPRARTARRPS